MKHEKVVERADEQALIESFLHYYQASDSELTSVAVAYYWLVSIFPLLMIMVNILPYFQIPVSNFLLTIKEFCLIQCMMWSPRLSEVLTQPSTGLLSFAVLSALWTFSKSMDFLQKLLTKPMEWPKVEGLSPISWWVCLLASACRFFLPWPCFWVCLVVCCSTSSKLTGNQIVRYFPTCKILQALWSMPWSLPF